MVDSNTRLADPGYDDELRTIRAHAQALPVAEQRWQESELPLQERQRDRMAFRYEWHDTVTRFEELAAAYLARRMSGEQAEQFRALIALLRDTLPAVRRLRLREPAPDLLGRLAAGPSPPRTMRARRRA